MTNRHTNEPTRQPLRLCPGVIIVALQWLLRFVVPIIIPEALTVGVMGGLVCGLAVVVWWGFFSRARFPQALRSLLSLSAITVSPNRCF